MSRHSPSTTRKPSCPVSRWYIVLGLPGSRTWTRTPTCASGGTSSPRAPNFSFTNHGNSPTEWTYQSATPDPRAEELVWPDGLAAVLAVDDSERGEARAAVLAAPNDRPAALRARLRYIGLELLEPAACRAA